MCLTGCELGRVSELQRTSIHPMIMLFFQLFVFDLVNFNLIRLLFEVGPHIPMKALNAPYDSHLYNSIFSSIYFEIKMPGLVI